MTNTTIRDLSSGAAIQDGDLFIARQGADTVDVSVTGSQLKTYVGSSGGTVTDVSIVTANGFAGSVATSTTTPAITITTTLGAGQVPVSNGTGFQSAPLTGTGNIVLATSPSFSGATITTSTVNGVTLVSGGTSTEYLSEDGTYSTPSTSPTGSAGGVLSGTYPNPGFASSPVFSGAITGGTLNLTADTNQIVLDSDGTFTGTITMAALSGSRTWTLPNSTGTIVLAANSSTLTNKTINGPDNTLTNIAQSSITNLTSDLALKAPLASPTFTGTVTLPAGQVVNGVTLTTAGSATDFLNAQGNYASAGGGSSAFSAITAGTNTTAAMVVGTGASLAASGSGTITATAVPVGGVSGLGTGVATALAVNTGSAGAFVVNGGALGTPSSGTATNLTGTAAGLTAGTATALATGRTIAITGDLAYTSPAFDGSGNVTAAGTLATVNANVGSFGSATQTAAFTVNAKGLTTAASNVTITPAVGSITGLGTGIATALAVNVGTAGSIVVNGGALGTPSGGTLTNATGLPIVAGTTGTLTETRGGTNQTTYTTGDILYASASNTLSKLAGVATGNALISRGVTTAPSWGKIGLTTHVSGILPVANGGTNNAFFTVSGPATSAKTYTFPNATTTVLTTNAAVTVAQGGTGRATSTTAYGLLAAGTTATGAHQTLAAGATTDILVGGGASALPVWTAATGSGSPVRATSPTLVTPALGTPTALVGTNITGTASGLTAGTVTTNANLTGDVTSVGNATSIGTGVIVNADVNASAAIAVSKLAALTTSRAVVTDGSGFVSAATTTATEIGYVNGVTSAIQTQLNAKPTLTVLTPTTGAGATSYDFTVTGAKVIWISANGLSSNGSSDVLIQLGDAGGIENTGYGGVFFRSVATSVSNEAHSTGFIINGNAANSDVISGNACLTLIDGTNNIWAINGGFSRTDAAVFGSLNGAKTLTQAITTLRITAANGTDTIDAGTFNVSFLS